MSDLKLFRISGNTASEIDGSAMALEKSLQSLIERNLEQLLGVRFLATEHGTGRKHAGRIDTLGIDENGSPVIIEYKRAMNENVINQGLFYLDWLMDHKAEFKLLVMERYGADEAGRIDWSSPRLLCIAGDFTRYDEHAVQQMNRSIDLIRYRRFGDDLLLLELVNAVSGEDGSASTPGRGAASGSGKVSSGNTYKTVTQSLQDLSQELTDLYEELRAFIHALGDDVQEKTLKLYVAFRRIKNFVCVEARTQRGVLVLYLRLDPDTVNLENGFTRDMRGIGHFGTGDLEVVVGNRADLEKAKPLILRAYEGG
jgi:predicted transport protein